eukprot:CAMPEP_0206259540 /NCGR_PEP_ID=MMETSP0047_2-20121206/26547_1 /ASSEMBLY_ACC=CAM_ASM_000192 /TAXON_ID=195065 /ORGANISM="Chroomonas mesostigmatica_cf, Strain CCMP1168" /LENGTH=99 /DNA_ID=CAMNT_0053686437 /DNA_START=61 /DNA_END=357 /DNA_ORIENTATION=-
MGGVMRLQVIVADATQVLLLVKLKHPLQPKRHRRLDLAAPRGVTPHGSLRLPKQRATPLHSARLARVCAELQGWALRIKHVPKVTHSRPSSVALCLSEA